MAADNREAYETVSWIMENADTGFFIVTAPHNMQRRLAELYKTAKVEIFDYSRNVSSTFSFSEISAWAEPYPEADFLFILNMQLALREEKDMLSFNLNRDMLSKMNKSWLFFMTKDTENLLATFAFDIYSYVRLKAHFLPEKDEELFEKINFEIETPVNFNKAKEALARYKDLEEQLASLSLANTPDNQLLSAAISLSNIAELYNNCAEYENALRLYDIVRKIREKTLGAWHPDTGETYNNIANVYVDQNDNNKALEWYKKALDVAGKTMGKDHPNTAAIYNNIAIVYSKQDNYTKALEFFKKALVIYEKAYGWEHPVTVITYNNIALSYTSQGDYTKALEWNEKALVIRESTLGSEHCDTARSYFSIALTYGIQCEYKKSLIYFEKALKIFEKILSKEHPETARTYNSIAKIHLSQGDYINALEFFEKALEIREKILGSDHPDTESTRRSIAQIEKIIGDFTDPV